MKAKLFRTSKPGVCPEVRCLAASQLLGPTNRVVGLDAATKTLSLTNGDKVVYESLISTMPLDLTLSWLGKQEWADGLTHRSVRMNLEESNHKSTLLDLIVIHGTIIYSQDGKVYDKGSVVKTISSCSASEACEGGFRLREAGLEVGCNHRSISQGPESKVYPRSTFT